MLVLTRKVGEKIVTGDGVVLTVVAVDGGRVRLGIDAPPWIKVWRQELVSCAAAPKPASDPEEPLRALRHRSR